MKTNFGDYPHREAKAYVRPKWMMVFARDPILKQWQRFFCSVLGHKFILTVGTWSMKYRDYRCNRCGKFKRVGADDEAP